MYMPILTPEGRAIAFAVHLFRQAKNIEIKEIILKLQALLQIKQKQKQEK